MPQESKLQHVDIKVNPDYHRRLIGKKGATIDKIKNETGAQITVCSCQVSVCLFCLFLINKIGVVRFLSLPLSHSSPPSPNTQIPQADTHSDIIRVEGSAEAVVAAKAAIEALVTQMANFKTMDMIIDRKFHGLLIGPKGATIGDIQAKFPSLNIKMPSSSTDSEIVT